MFYNIATSQRETIESDLATLSPYKQKSPSHSAITPKVHGKVITAPTFRASIFLLAQDFFLYYYMAKNFWLEPGLC